MLYCNKCKTLNRSYHLVETTFHRIPCEDGNIYYGLREEIDAPSKKYIYHSAPFCKGCGEELTEYNVSDSKSLVEYMKYNKLESIRIDDVNTLYFII